MKNRILIFFIIFQSTLCLAQTNANLIINAIDANDPSLLLDSINMDLWNPTEKELAQQYLKDFMTYKNEKNLSLKKIKGDKGIHLLDLGRVVLFCNFINNENYTSLSFGPTKEIKYINLPNIDIIQNKNATSFQVRRKPVIKRHNILSDFDDGMKTDSIEKQFKFDPAALENFNKFKVLYKSKKLFMKHSEPSAQVGVARGTYWRDEYRAELNFILGYIYHKDYYQVTVFTFEHFPEKKKDKK